MSQRLTVCPCHRLVNWGTEQFSNLPKLYTEPEFKHLPSSSRVQALCYYTILPLRKMEYEETSRFFHCSPRRWTEQPTRLYLLCLVIHGSDRTSLEISGHWSTSRKTSFPQGRNASSICESDLPHPNTWHSLDTEPSRAVLGSGGMRVPALHFWEVGMFGIVLLFYWNLPVFPAALRSHHSTMQHAGSPVLMQTL